jgi:hypothetical protein
VAAVRQSGFLNVGLSRHEEKRNSVMTLQNRGKSPMRLFVKVLIPLNVYLKWNVYIWPSGSGPADKKMVAQ